MARLSNLIAALAISALCMVGSAFACEEFRAHGATELKEFRDKLVEVDADPLDRLFAFEELICSDKPAVRAFAVREGLRASTDPLLRHQIMLEAMMSKRRLDIALSLSSNAGSAEREFVKKHDGLYSSELRHRSRSGGCMSTYSWDRCDQHLVLISGDLVQFTYGSLIGEFRLSDDNKLVGFMKNGNSGKIPASIDLF